MKNRGGSLIEVLVALSLLTTVLLGAGLAALKSLRMVQETYHHTQALLTLESAANMVQAYQDNLPSVAKEMDYWQHQTELLPEAHWEVTYLPECIRLNLTHAHHVGNVTFPRSSVIVVSHEGKKSFNSSTTGSNPN